MYPSNGTAALATYGATEMGLFNTPHFPDCDNAYPDSPLENTVCNVAENHHLMDNTRICLQEQKAHGVGIVERHLSCWYKALKGD